jgi:hypothetical protein
MSNLATIVDNILADSGIDDINVVVTTGSYANPAWITSLAWTKITGAPANIVTGTGTAGQVAFFNGTNSIGSEINLLWDSSNNRLGIGVTPTQALDVVGKIKATDDLVLAQQNPAISFDNGVSGTLRIFSSFAADTVATFNSTGGFRLNQYGTGARTGTRAYDLAVDASGNVIEVAVGAGTITGGGTVGQVTFWNGSSSVDGDVDFTWNNSTKTLGVNGFVDSYRRFRLYFNDIQTLAAELYEDGASTNGGTLTLYSKASNTISTVISAAPTKLNFINNAANVMIGWNTDQGYKLAVNGTGYFSNTVTASMFETIPNSSGGFGINENGNDDVRYRFYQFSTSGTTYVINTQMGASGEYDIWQYSGAWRRNFSMTALGAATFSSSLTAESGTFITTATTGTTDLLILSRNTGGWGRTVFRQSYNSTFFTNGKTLSLANDSGIDFAHFAGNNAGTRTDFILTTGNIGIGENSPADRIVIKTASGDAGITLNSVSAGQTLRIDQNSIRTSTNSPINIFTNNTSGFNSFFIGNDGRFGIGTTTNLYGKLSVEAAGNHITLRAPGATAGKYWALDVTTANQFYIVNNAGSQYLTILDGGNTGLGVVTPSVKLDVGADSSNRSILRLSSNAANRAAAVRFDGNNAESGYIGYEGGSEIVGGGVQGDLVIRNVLASKNIILATNNGRVGINTIDPQAPLDVNGNAIFRVTDVSNATGGFTITNDGTSPIVSPWGFGSNPIFLVTTQVGAAPHIAANQSTDNSAGVVFRGFKSRGTADANANVSNGDSILTIDAWAMHTSGPNAYKFGGGMTWYKDDGGGTASTFAPMSLRFTMANSTTTIIDAMKLLYNGNLLIGTDFDVAGAKLNVNGNIRTAAPAGGSSANWKLGNATSPTMPTANRLVRIEIDGTIYQLLAFGA